MTASTLKLTLNTVKYLKPKQIFYRVYYFFRNRFTNKSYSKVNPAVQNIHWENTISSPISFHEKSTFKFLNIDHKFEIIDWNYGAFGKLWTYNLNYFDFLQQKDISKDQGLFLMHDYIKNKDLLKDGMEPYPISLRGMNWIKFISIHKIGDPDIDSFLYNNYLQLLDNLEYHILGNHLLENGFSLLFAAHYFGDNKFFKKAKNVIQKELKEQILDDGAHFERSPMYHQIMLYRLLDCIQLVESNEQFNSGSLLSMMKTKATLMLSFMEEICFDNGDFPQFNDAAYGIVPVRSELMSYAKSLGIHNKKIPLASSGYRKNRVSDIEIISNVGQIGPSYQPGHAHADTFSFCLNHKGKPIIVDTGTSTYNIGKRRNLERSTLSHNTVAYDGKNSSEVWDGFRVADRAQVSILEENGNFLFVSHDGYRKSKVIHKRKFDFTSFSVTIKDTMEGDVKKSSHTSLHFHPDVRIEFMENELTLNNELRFTWEGLDKVSFEDYLYAPEFNRLVNAKKFLGEFREESKLKLEIIKN